MSAALFEIDAFQKGSEKVPPQLSCHQEIALGDKTIASTCR
jgi:hypothetical protein